MRKKERRGEYEGVVGSRGWCSEVGRTSIRDVNGLGGVNGSHFFQSTKILFPSPSHTPH
jgi:hypothetical protein